jgi:hypothetical protein
MPRKNNKRGKKKKSSGGRPTIEVSGMLSRMGLPIPRLPFLIGSATNLGAGKSVYPRSDYSIPIIPQILGIVAGGLTTNLSVQASSALIQNWAAFVALFGEFCLVGFTFELRMNNVVNPAGLVVVYVDEKSAAAPTAAVAFIAPHLEIVVSNTESPSRHMISWRAKDLADLNWVSTSSVEQPVWLKLFAASAFTGTLATTTGSVMLTGALQVCFRGFVQ